MRAVIVAAAVAFVLTLFGTPIAIRVLAEPSIRPADPGHQSRRTPEEARHADDGRPRLHRRDADRVRRRAPRPQDAAGRADRAARADDDRPRPARAHGVLRSHRLRRRLSSRCPGATAPVSPGAGRSLLQIVVGGVFGALALTAKSTAGVTVSGNHAVVHPRHQLGAHRRDRSPWSLFIAVVMATTNGVNLTDGLDGLATGTSVVVLFAYMMISFWQYRHWCADTAATC